MVWKLSLDEFQKLLFSPLSVDSSSSSVSSSLEELKRYDPKSEVENIQNDDKSQSNTDLEEQYMWVCALIDNT